MKWVELLKTYLGQEAGKQIQVSDEDAVDLVNMKYAKEVLVSVDAEITAKATEALSGKFVDAVSKAVDTALAAVTNAVKDSRPRIDVTLNEADKTKSFADFLKSIAAGDGQRLTTVYGSRKAALLENSGTTGGYLVPPEFLAKLMEIAAEEAIVRPRANIIPMASRSILIPMLDQTTVQSAGTTPFFGGMIARWTAEAQTRQETEPQFKQIELIAHELAGLSLVSRTLAADAAFGIDALLTRMFGKTIGWYEDYAFLQGDGVGKPKGVIPSPSCISVTRGSANTFKLVDAANMYAKMLPASAGKAIWVMSQTLLPQLIQLADASGRVIYLPNPAATSSSGGAATQSVPMSLLGRPVMFTEKLPALGSTGDVLFADFSHYLLGDRSAIEVAASDHFKFDTNQTTWRFMHRVDGQPWLDAPITYQDGSTTVSPFVRLV